MLVVNSDILYLKLNIKGEEIKEGNSVGASTCSWQLGLKM
jgi:hypothetical protein